MEMLNQFIEQVPIIFRKIKRDPRLLEQSLHSQQALSLFTKLIYL